jgi:hypothetical protein
MEAWIPSQPMLQKNEYLIFTFCNIRKSCRYSTIGASHFSFPSFRSVDLPLLKNYDFS